MKRERTTARLDSETIWYSLGNTKSAGIQTISRALSAAEARGFRAGLEAAAEAVNSVMTIECGQFLTASRSIQPPESSNE